MPSLSSHPVTTAASAASVSSAASRLLAHSPFVKAVQRDELTCLEIRHPQFSADLLLQGAQLIHYAPEGENNWLWLSGQAEYKQGQSVRGGIPVCWPWFGNAAMNPAAVKAAITDPEQAPAHGFARARQWQLSDLYEACDRVEITLTLNDHQHPQWAAQLNAEAQFIFRADSLAVNVISQNNGTEPVCFSQALHTYFPTDDVRATQVLGFEGERYIETLEGWCEKTQQGPVRFNGETDRIYDATRPLRLISPQQRLLLQSCGSASAVVWNPHIEKSLRLSQFAADAWMRMFCVETANAFADVITLAAGEKHCLGLQLSSLGQS